MKIDLVLPYVDMTKEQWKKLYNITCKKEGRIKAENNRYRELIDLKYLLRCIDKNCPFISTLYLVVQTKDQVPDYVKESEYLKIIEHKDIIPEDLLPTYNSGTIECYIYKIPNLSEHFIYINDDMYPMLPLSESDFFNENGQPKINIKIKQQGINVYRSMLKNSEIFVRNLLNQKVNTDIFEFYRDGHSWTPMIKSHWEYLHEEGEVYIKGACSTFRLGKNLVQQIATYYELFTNNLDTRTINTKYWSFKKSLDSLWNFLSGNYHIVCINDTGLSGDPDFVSKQLTDWFKQYVPEKSKKYEI